MTASDPTRLTRSDLVPVLSSHGFLSSLPLSKSFWAVVALGAAEIFLFEATRNPAAQTRSLTAVIVIALLFLGIFLAAMMAFMRAKASLAHAAFGIAVVAPLMQTEIVWYWIGFWRSPIFDPAGLGGLARPHTTLGYFISMFFGAGVAEDTIKIAPAPLLLLVAVLVRRLRGPDATFLRAIEPFRPTTIIMVALGGAAAFVFVETVYQYVPGQIDRVARSTARMAREALACVPLGEVQGRTPAEIARNQNCLRIAADYGIALGYLDGILLLMARLIGFISGHGAYAAVAAYGLVLAANKTRGRNRLAVGTLMMVGAVCVSATLHGLWNTLDQIFGREDYSSPLVLAVASMVILLAVVAKARQLDRQLGYEAGRQLGDSLVLAPVVPVFAGGAPAAAGARQAAATAARGATAAIATLVVDGTCIAIVPDATLDLAAHVPRAAGVAFEVVSRPGDAAAFGLRNRGIRAWQIMTASGRVAEVAPGRVAALSDGIAIDFGPVNGTVTTGAAP